MQTTQDAEAVAQQPPARYVNQTAAVSLFAPHEEGDFAACVRLWGGSDLIDKASAGLRELADRIAREHAGAPEAEQRAAAKPEPDAGPVSCFAVAVFDRNLGGTIYESEDLLVKRSEVVDRARELVGVLKGGVA